MPAVETLKKIAEKATGWARPDAADLAFDLLAAYEGSALLANTMHDPDVLSQAAYRINHWIDTL